MEMILDVQYEACKRWIKTKREKGKSWEAIFYACKKNDEQLADFLKIRIEEDDWPEDLSCENWKVFVGRMKEAEEKSIAIQKAGGMATITSKDENTRVTVPEDDRTAWQLYKKRLASKGFKAQDIDNIERAKKK